MLYRNRAGKIGRLDRRAGIADLETAAKWIKLAIRQNPYDAESRSLYTDLAALLARVGRKQEALAMLDEAMALCPHEDPWAAQIGKLRSQIAAP
jgi:Flp pilus assembly protein TadD